MDEFVGVIRLCSGMYVPKGFLPCNGQQLPINQYPALFAVIGITYGGDGTSYFNLPNFNGRAPVHAGTVPGLTSRTLGQAGGTESVTMTTDQIPAHSHPVAGTNVSIQATVHVSGRSGNSTQATNNGIAQGAATLPAPFNTVPKVYDREPSFLENNKMHNSTVNISELETSGGLTSPAGSSLPIPLMQPYLALHFAICVDGVFPVKP